MTFEKNNDIKKSTIKINPNVIAFGSLENLKDAIRKNNRDDKSLQRRSIDEKKVISNCV